MITSKRVVVAQPEDTRRNRTKKVVKLNAYSKADRRSSKRALKQY